MTQQELILELVTLRVKRNVERKKKESQAFIYAQCGRGANPSEFQGIIDKLAKEGFLTVTLSERRTPVLNFVEAAQITGA